MIASLPFKEILLVVLGGLFGWSLGKLPDKRVYVFIVMAILLTLHLLLYCLVSITD